VSSCMKETGSVLMQSRVASHIRAPVFISHLLSFMFKLGAMAIGPTCR
jgi:hypothetical protein